LLSSRRRSEEAIAEAWHACELDPISLSANVCLGAACYLGRRYEEAQTMLQGVLDVKPGFGPALMWLGACYTMKSLHAEAIASLERAREHRPHPLVHAWLGAAYATAGRMAEAERVLQDLAGESARNYVSAFCFALIHAGLGQIDQAFDWLAKARQQRCPFFAVLFPADPRLDLLRSDSRYSALADRFSKEEKL
jgi:tetratricopeptide (TPR) repeat protein